MIFCLKTLTVNMGRQPPIAGVMPPPKRSMSFLALAYHKEYNLPIIIARLFNTVGPRQIGRYGMVLPNFVKQALANKPITIYGDGEQSRSFTYVGDCVTVLKGLMDSDKSVGEVFNIGNSEEISIKGLAERVKELSKSKSELVYIPYEEAYEGGFEDMQRRCPDNSKIKNLLGYKPSKTLDELIQVTIDYHRRTGQVKNSFSHAKPQSRKDNYILSINLSMIIYFLSLSLCGLRLCVKIKIDIKLKVN